MARTRKTTASIEQPEDVVVELQPGIQEQDPVEQSDEPAEAVAPDDEPERTSIPSLSSGVAASPSTRSA